METRFTNISISIYEQDTKGINIETELSSKKVNYNILFLLKLHIS